MEFGALAARLLIAPMMAHLSPVLRLVPERKLGKPDEARRLLVLAPLVLRILPHLAPLLPRPPVVHLPQVPRAGPIPNAIAHAMLLRSLQLLVNAIPIAPFEMAIAQLSLPRLISPLLPDVAIAILPELKPVPMNLVQLDSALATDMPPHEDPSPTRLTTLVNVPPSLLASAVSQHEFPARLVKLCTPAGLEDMLIENNAALLCSPVLVIVESRPVLH